MRYTASSQPVANFSVATSRSWKNKSTDEWEEETEWHDVTVWGDKAEKAANELRRGSKVYVEGRLKTESWQDKKYPEIKHSKKSIVADTFISLDPRSSQPAGEFVAPEGGFGATEAPARKTQYSDIDDLPF